MAKTGVVVLVKTLGVIANCGKPRAGDVLGALKNRAAELGITLVTDDITASLLNAPVKPIDEMLEEVDAVMALGGDGTMLRVMRELGGRDKPVIGVNIGSLGFLTSVAEEHLDTALECLASDDFVIDEAAVVECEVVGGGTGGRYTALNDVVVSNGPSSRVITLELRIDGDYVTSYVCDGLIVSTPSGSTGHSLSAGGPILSPATPAVVISLICPHTLSSRPLVVPDQSEISVSVSNCEQVVLSVDGQVGEPLQRGSEIKVRRSNQGVSFIRLPGHSYFAVLRQKLRWRGSNV